MQCGPHVYIHTDTVTDDADRESIITPHLPRLCLCLWKIQLQQRIMAVQAHTHTNPCMCACLSPSGVTGAYGPVHVVRACSERAVAEGVRVMRFAEKGPFAVFTVALSAVVGVSMLLFVPFENDRHPGKDHVFSGVGGSCAAPILFVGLFLSLSFVVCPCASAL